MIVMKTTLDAATEQQAKTLKCFLSCRNDLPFSETTHVDAGSCATVCLRPWKARAATDEQYTKSASQFTGWLASNYCLWICVHQRIAQEPPKESRPRTTQDKHNIALPQANKLRAPSLDTSSLGPSKARTAQERGKDTSP